MSPSVLSRLTRLFLKRPELLRIDAAAVRREVAQFITVPHGDDTSTPQPALEVRASPIVGAGRGVFAARALPAMSVCSLYPGRVIPPPPPALVRPLDGDLPAGTLLPAELSPYAPMNAYVMNCEDGGRCAP